MLAEHRLEILDRRDVPILAAKQKAAGFGAAAGHRIESLEHLVRDAGHYAFIETQSIHGVTWGIRNGPASRSRPERRFAARDRNASAPPFLRRPWRDADCPARS